MQIRTATIDDFPQVLSLYKRVATIPGGIARLVDEVDESYIRAFLSKTNANDVALVALDEFEKVTAEIHAYTPGLYCFSHVLSDLTVVVDPCTQGMGVVSVFKQMVQKSGESKRVFCSTFSYYAACR